MTDGLAWRMTLNETPHRVFCALVRVTSEHGRLCGVHDFGRQSGSPLGVTWAGPCSRRG